MKSPAEYVAAVLPPGTLTPSLSQAAAAVSLALADAERYRELLLRAIRNSKPK